MREDLYMQAEQTDYFADRLLGMLDAVDPALIAYEAQDVSRKVGFDFDNFGDVVPRALDEVRETREARAETADPAVENSREHYGDEIADLMFSAVNLARHGGIAVAELASLTELEGRAESQTQQPESDDPEAMIAAVEASIQHLAGLYTAESPEFEAELRAAYAVQMTTAIRLARTEGFDPTVLLRENVRKYLTRCQTMETIAERDGKQWADLHRADEIVTYWKKAKNVERGLATIEAA